MQSIPNDQSLSTQTRTYLQLRQQQQPTTISSLLTQICETVATNPIPYPITIQTIFEQFALADDPPSTPDISKEDSTEQQQQPSLTYAEWIDAFHASSGTWKLAQITGILPQTSS